MEFTWQISRDISKYGPLNRKDLPFDAAIKSPLKIKIPGLLSHIGHFYCRYRISTPRKSFLLHLLILFSGIIRADLVRTGLRGLMRNSIIVYLLFIVWVSIWKVFACFKQKPLSLGSRSRRRTEDINMISHLEHLDSEL